MNYTTGEPINLHSECVCESPRGSIPVKNAPPALPTQLTYLTEKVGCHVQQTGLHQRVLQMTTNICGWREDVRGC